MVAAKLRGFLNQHSAIATIVAVALLVLALAIIVLQNNKQMVFDYEVYYYDLNTQKIFAAHVSLSTPFDNGAGLYDYDDGMKGSAVRATVLTCGDPSQIKEGMSLAEIREVGGEITYLERRSPHALALEAKVQAGIEPSMDEMGYDFFGSIIASPDDLVWYSMESEGGMRIFSETPPHCEAEQVPQICFP
ncbi:hypothetical protein [Algisphaera agarilytica]|uniref:Uncharacterized protein n=1 Tax=Algisphaera agarilytica TaxID=1385975 RepID=A0A7X0LL39_9BACT|nr:hypothetical protein [Algisphaera agarilytica]MBB6431100.1 hypothetical protein [Algisphaera agarilytica]